MVLGGARSSDGVKTHSLQLCAAANIGPAAFLPLKDLWAPQFTERCKREIVPHGRFKALQWKGALPM